LFITDYWFIGITFPLFTLFLFYWFKEDFVVTVVTNLENRITFFFIFLSILGGIFIFILISLFNIEPMEVFNCWRSLCRYLFLWIAGILFIEFINTPWNKDSLLNFGIKLCITILFIFLFSFISTVILAEWLTLNKDGGEGQPVGSPLGGNEGNGGNGNLPNPERSPSPIGDNRGNTPNLVEDDMLAAANSA